MRTLPFQLTLECLLDILGSESTSSNLLSSRIEETLNCSKCFVELVEDLGTFPKAFGS